MEQDLTKICQVLPCSATGDVSTQASAILKVLTGQDETFNISGIPDAIRTLSLSGPLGLKLPKNETWLSGTNATKWQSFQPQTIDISSLNIEFENISEPLIIDSYRVLAITNIGLFNTDQPTAPQAVVCFVYSSNNGYLTVKALKSDFTFHNDETSLHMNVGRSIDNYTILQLALIKVQDGDISTTTYLNTSTTTNPAATSRLGGLTLYYPLIDRDALKVIAANDSIKRYYCTAAFATSTATQNIKFKFSLCTNKTYAILKE